MSVGSFLKLVEIQTKVASVIPFFLGTFYALYRFGTFNFKNFLIMLGSLLCIDMVTTAINNYLDYKRANRKYGYGYESHNAIVRDNLKESHVLAAIFVLFITATGLGVLLYLNTNLVVLAVGALSFAIGVLYSFGPFPISRTPFGEIFSGGFMGFLIPFLAVYIHVFDRGIVDLTLKNGTLSLNIGLLELLYILMVSFPAVTGIANIMLANNICDIEDDIENKRYTLPIYIGRKNSLEVFRILYYSGFAAVVLLLVMRIIPLLSALVLLTFIPVNRHINIFFKEQSKKDTFVLSVKNFVIVNVVFVLTLAVAAVYKAIF